MHYFIFDQLLPILHIMQIPEPSDVEGGVTLFMGQMKYIILMNTTVSGLIK